MPALAELIARGFLVEAHRPFPRVVAEGDLWRELAGELAGGRATLLALWGEPSAVHMGLLLGVERTPCVVTRACPERHFLSIGRVHPPAIRFERTIRDLYGIEPEGLPDPRPWLDHGRWGLRYPLAATPEPSPSPIPYAF